MNIPIDTKDSVSFPDPKILKTTTKRPINEEFQHPSDISTEQSSNNNFLPPTLDIYTTSSGINRQSNNYLTTYSQIGNKVNNMIFQPANNTKSAGSNPNFYPLETSQRTESQELRYIRSKSYI